ncbi:hypothetical protein PMI34_00693 [Pseudomonas sp. GM74]|nr:hypothetical protein PMI34_00693 [Pseudomonas sp. GM74]
MIRGIRITSVSELTPSRASPLPQWFMSYANVVYTRDTCGSGLAREEASSHPTQPQGSNPIPRKITLVTVCTAFSNCMSDNG